MGLQHVQLNLVATLSSSERQRQERMETETGVTSWNQSSGALVREVGSPEKNLATAEALAEAAVQGWARRQLELEFRGHRGPNPSTSACRLRRSLHDIRYGPGEADDVSLLLCQPVGATCLQFRWSLGLGSDGA